MTTLRTTAQAWTEERRKADLAIQNLIYAMEETLKVDSLPREPTREALLKWTDHELLALKGLLHQADGRLALLSQLLLQELARRRAAALEATEH